MRFKLSHLVIMGLIVALLSSWFTATVMSQTPQEKARNRTVMVRSGSGQCSGVVLQTNLVLTAAHCISDGMMVDGKPARLGKIDAKVDLALLYCDTIVIDRIAVADVAVGDDVFSWGFPLGSPNKVFSKGYVSVIQFETVYTTTVVAPGSSGSGLFDSSGRLVGIVGGIMPSTGYGTHCLPETIRKFWEAP